MSDPSGSADINSNQGGGTGVVYRGKPPDITITASTLPSSSSSHNLNYRRGSDSYRRGSDNSPRRLSAAEDRDEDEEFERACNQYIQRDKRRRCSNVGLRRKADEEEQDLTRSNLIAVTLFILAILSLIMGLKLMYF